MNIYGWNKKYAIYIVCMILTCLITLVVVKAWKSYRDDQENNQKTDDRKEMIEIEKDDSVTIEVSNDSIVTGTEVIAKYAQVKGEECSILVATSAFLEGNQEELVDPKEYPYICYVLSEQNQDRVENVYTKNGMFVPLAYVNYNIVLGDTCLYQTYSKTSYEAPYGFLKKKKKHIYFPLTLSKNDTIYTIHEDAKFLSKIIYNEKGKIVGYAFLEQ